KACPASCPRTGEAPSVDKTRSVSCPGWLRKVSLSTATTPRTRRETDGPDDDEDANRVALPRVRSAPRRRREGRPPPQIQRPRRGRDERRRPHSVPPLPTRQRPHGVPRGLRRNRLPTLNGGPRRPQPEDFDKWIWSK